MPAPLGTTLLEIVQKVARSVGHPAPTTVAASTDEAVLRMQYYANLAGAQLAYMCNWQALSKTAIINVVGDFAGQDAKGFDLPTDFKTMTDDTQWDSNTQLPAIGPINPQDWQSLIQRVGQITTRFLWRIRDGQLWIKSPPFPTSQPFSFEYLSKYWALDPNVSGNPADPPTPVESMELDTSWHIYSPQLMILYTRAKWFENEGYDAAAAFGDFQKAFQWEAGGDKGATALSIVPNAMFPYINAIFNAPDTGYGS